MIPHLSLAGGTRFGRQGFNSKLNLAIVMLLLMGLTFGETSRILQDDSTSLDSGESELQKIQDAPIKTKTFLSGEKPAFTIDSIHPAHGPVTGDTKVTVRGEGLDHFKSEFPEPKCRFGSNNAIVKAEYFSCKPDVTKATDRDGSHNERSSTCIMCENSPASIESKPVEFTVSLTGNFDDVSSAAQFYYYKTVKISALKPHHGPKDGGTTVQVWGENFQDFGEETLCNFGVTATPASIHSSNYATCQSPPSDVV